MSTTRSGKNRRGSSGRTDGKYDWSKWVWNEEKGKYYRYRINSKGNKVSESTTTLPNPTTPRSIVPATTDEYEDNNATSTSYDGSQNYYEGDSYDHREQASTSIHEPIEDLSEDFANTSLYDQETSRRHDGHYYQGRGYQEPADESGIGNYQSSAVAIMDPYRYPTEYPGQPSMYSSFGRTTDYMGPSSSTLIAERTSYYTPPINNSTYPPQQASYGDSGDDPALMSQSYTSQATITPGMQIAPPEPLEVPSAISEGYTRDHIRRNIVSNTEGNHERLDSRFRVHKSDKFKPGHIFKVLWSEPRGETSRPSTTSDATDATTDYWFGKHGEEVYSTVRRFVIVATDFGHSQCLPILTYKHQATTKGGVKNESHAIIYTGQYPPAPLRGESLFLEPVQMIGKTHRDVLLPESRINYSKIYTVEHNVKVFFIGWIAEGSQRRVLTDFDQVWSNKLHMTC